jgi:hypothetical protein
MAETPKPQTAAMKAAIAANAKLGKSTPKPTATAKPKVTLPPVTGATTDLIPPNPSGTNSNVSLGASNNWAAFEDGTLNYNQGGLSNGVQLTPYISSGSNVKGAQPTSIIITPSADGKGYTTQDADVAAKNAIKAIPASLLQSYKQKLQSLYTSTKAFQTSMATKDTDVAFAQAVKKALEELSVQNFFNGIGNAKALATNPKAALPNPLYDFNTYVSSRPAAILGGTSTESVRSLTTQADALQEFAGTVRANVGDPLLVDNYAALANAYWLKLHASELARVSVRTSTTDPVTNQTSGSSTGYSQLTNEDRLAMQIDLITHGDANAKSTGILNVDSAKLQAAGGLMGDAYTKIIKSSLEQGIPLTHQQVVDKVNKAFTKGGSVDQQILTLGELAKAHYQNLTPFLEKGLTVKDLASQYQTAKETELEQATGSVGVMDPTVQAALRADKLPGLNDYIAQVRALPEWRNTKGANESAAGMIDAILKTWGKVG